MTSTRYDAIGEGYARTRREDPALRARTLNEYDGGLRLVVSES